MATDFSQLTPEQQSAIAKYAASTYGNSPKALGMVQQKLAQDPSFANQQLQRFGYKVGVDTSGVNEFNPMAEGMSYDQDIRRALADGEQEAPAAAKAPPSGKAAPASGSAKGGRGGTTAADGSIPVPKARPAGVNPLDANGTVEDASAKKATPSDDPSTFAANATEAALVAGGGAAAVAAGMHLGDKLSSRGAAAVPPAAPAADEDMIQMIMRASGATPIAGPPAAPALPAQAAAGALPPPPAALPAPQGPVGSPPSPTDDMIVKSMMASGAGQTDQAGAAMRLKGLINQTGSPEAAVQMMLQQREYPPELILDMARQVGVQLPGGTPILPDASRAAAKAIPRP